MPELSKIVQESVCHSKLATRPILYTDTVGGKQTLRDDLWAVTTEELNEIEFSSQISLLEAELERKKGMTKETLEQDSLMLLTRHERETYGEEVLGYNQAIQEDITYLTEQIEECRKLLN